MRQTPVALRHATNGRAAARRASDSQYMKESCGCGGRTTRGLVLALIVAVPVASSISIVGSELPWGREAMRPPTVPPPLPQPHWHVGMPVNGGLCAPPAAPWPSEYAHQFATLLRVYEALDGPRWPIGTRGNWTEPSVNVCCWSGVACEDVGNLNVTHLVMYNWTGVAGTMPAAVAELRSLRVLFLGRMPISGTIPPEIGRLSGTLSSLSLARLDLHGTVPHELFELRQLTTLELFQNQLSGTLSNDIGNLRSLQSFSVDNNRLVGSIPEGLWRCNSLRDLRLWNNLLTSTISPAVGNLRNLTVLDLSPQLNLHGTIPEEVWSLSNLETLFLDQTGGMTGTLSDKIGRLQRLKTLDIEGNDFSGSLPSSLFSLQGLRTLVLQDNMFSGTLSPLVGNLTVLRQLSLDSNNFSGALPHEVFRLSGSRLRYLSLGNNMWDSGPIPAGDIARLSQLEVLDLGSMNLRGSVPAELFTLSTLWFLNLSGNNRIADTLSPQFGQLKSLRTLLLHGCDFAGSIPASFGQLNQLELLTLSDNHRVTGPLPAELGSAQQLQALLLGGTDLTGATIPPEWGRLKQLSVLSLQSTGLGGSVPDSFNHLPAASEIVIASNILMGTVPAMTASKHLTRFEARGNRLSGVIPDAITQLPQLEILSLRNNVLGGLLPRFGSASNLSALCLDLNYLSCYPPTMDDDALPHISSSFHGADSGGLGPMGGQGVGPCLNNTLSVLTGNLLYCDLPSVLLSKDVAAGTYQCIRKVPSAIISITVGTLLFVAVLLLHRRVALQAKRSRRRVGSELAGPLLLGHNTEHSSSSLSPGRGTALSVARQGHAEVNLFLAFLRSSLWLTITSMALAGAAAGLFASSNSPATCRKRLLVTAADVRYDINEDADAIPVINGSQPLVLDTHKISPRYAYVLGLPGLAGMILLVVWAARSTLVTRSFVLKMDALPLPSGPSLFRLQRVSTASMKRNLFSALTVLLGMVFLLAPNVLYVYLSGSLSIAAELRTPLLVGLAAFKAATNSFFVPIMVRQVLRRVNASPQERHDVETFRSEVFIALTLRLVNMLVIPLASVLALDHRCLYGALESTPHADVTFSAKYCASHIYDDSGDIVGCLRYKQLPIEHGAFQWRWNPACPSALLDRYGPVWVVSVGLSGVAFNAARILRETASDYWRSKAGRDGLRRATRPTMRARALRAFLKPWHHSLSERYASWIAAIFINFSIGLIYPWVAWIGGVAQLCTWLAYRQMTVHGVDAEEAAEEARQQTRLAEERSDGGPAAMPPLPLRFTIQGSHDGLAMGRILMLGLLFSGALLCFVFCSGAFRGVPLIEQLWVAACLVLSVAICVMAALPVATHAGFRQRIEKERLSRSISNLPSRLQSSQGGLAAPRALLPSAASTTF